MAIAVSSLVALPPRDKGVGPRAVAMSLQHQPAGSASGFDRDGAPKLDALWAIAAELAPLAPTWPGMARPERRRWDLMAASEFYEAWVIAWPPGGAIELHDLAAGELVETSVVVRPSGGLALEMTRMGEGGSVRFTGRHVHDVVNVGDTPAVSVHVYAPLLTSMTYYRVTDGVLEAGSTVRYRFGEAVA
jgi:hypothetical protein